MTLQKVEKDEKAVGNELPTGDETMTPQRPTNVSSLATQVST